MGGYLVFCTKIVRTIMEIYWTPSTASIKESYVAHLVKIFLVHSVQHSSGLRPIPDPRVLVEVTFRFHENFPSYQTLLWHRSPLSNLSEPEEWTQSISVIIHRDFPLDAADPPILNRTRQTRYAISVRGFPRLSSKQICSRTSAWPTLVRSDCRCKELGRSGHQRQDRLSKVLEN